MGTMTERKPATRAGTPWERKGPDTRRSPLQPSSIRNSVAARKTPPAGGAR